MRTLLVFLFAAASIVLFTSFQTKPDIWCPYGKPHQAMAIHCVKDGTDRRWFPDPTVEPMV